MTINLKIKEIVVGKDRRPIDEQTVIALMDSIKQIGLLNPITVTNASELVAGLHRLEACKRLGWKSIQCSTIGGNYLDYALAEIDENLLRNELSVLDRAECLEKRKEIYETKYPETKHGVNRFTRSEENRVAENATLQIPDSFVESTAKITNQSPRTIYQDIEISKNLTPEVKELIRNEPIADKKTELLRLAKQEPEQQMEIASKIVQGEITKVADFFENVEEPSEDSYEVEDEELFDSPHSTGTDEPDYEVEEPTADLNQSRATQKEPVQVKPAVPIDECTIYLKELKSDMLTTLNAYSNIKNLRFKEILENITLYINGIR